MGKSSPFVLFEIIFREITSLDACRRNEKAALFLLLRILNSCKMSNNISAKLHVFVSEAVVPYYFRTEEVCNIDRETIMKVWPWNKKQPSRPVLDQHFSFFAAYLIDQRKTVQREMTNNTGMEGTWWTNPLYSHSQSGENYFLQCNKIVCIEYLLIQRLMQQLWFINCDFYSKLRIILTQL